MLHSAKSDEKKFELLSFPHLSIYGIHDVSRSHFHQAVLYRNLEVVRAMLNSVSQEYQFKLLTLRDHFKHIPLHDLCFGERRHGPIQSSKEFLLIKMMLACMNIAQRYEVLTTFDSDGHTPFAEAFRRGHNGILY